MAAALALALFLAQASVPAPDPALVETQTLIDSGRLPEAESALRAYLGTHRNAADAHYLLAFVLFKEDKPKLSLDAFAQASRLREPGALDLQVAGCDRFLLEDYPAADDLLARAVAKNPRDTTSLYFLGRAKYNEKQFAQAASIFARCPRDAKAQNYLGLASERSGRAADAEKAYRAAIALDPSAAEPYRNLGALLTGEGRAGEALPLLQKAVSLAPADFDALRELGKTELRLDHLQDARRDLEKAASEAPENAPVHFLLAEVYRKRGDANKAAAETARYEELSGTHSTPASPLDEARTLLELNKIADAERVTRAYLAVHKNSADGHFLLGYILFKKQDAKASLAEYTEGARYRTPAAADLEAVAADYVLLKDYPDADKWFSKALEWNPKNALGWYYLGRTKYNENRFEEAIAAFERCLELEPKNVKAEDNRGLALEGLNRMEEAAAAYRNAIAWQSGAAVKDSGPPLDLGSLLVETNRPSEGLPYLLEAAHISPKDARVHRALGKAYEHANQLAKAAAELEQAAALAPEDAPVHYMLAQVYRKQGLIEKAKKENELYASLTRGKPASEN